MAFPCTNDRCRISGFAPLPKNGTEAAIYRYSKSRAAFRLEPEQASWGGARNRKDRTTDFIAGDKAASIIAAARHACTVGLELNRHVTIHWERAGIPDEQAAEATGRFLKLAGDWLSKQRARTAYLWVRENGANKGSHVHILLHLPTGRSVGPMQRNWLKRIAGTRYRKGVIATRRIGGTANSAISNPKAYEANLAKIVAYVLKGTCPTAARALGLERVEPSGRIVGKRSATSQNIGLAGRKMVLD